MRTLELRTADGRSVARSVHMACSFRSRCLGLLRRASMPEHDGLLLVPGGSIHTLGMRFTIDVVFLNGQMRVLELAEHVAPWRVVVAPKGTARVLELAAGRIATIRLTVGTYLIVDAAADDPRAHHTPCEQTPIRFSLRLPAERRCTGPSQTRCSASAIRSLPPYRPSPGARATRPPSVGS